MVGQLSGGEQSAAGLLERVMQPLRQAPLIRAERVVRPGGSQRSENGFPDRLTGRGQPAFQQPGAIFEPIQAHAPVRLLLALLVRARAVRIEMSQNPLPEQPNRTGIAGPGVLQQRGLDRSGMFGPSRLWDRLHRLGNRRRVIGADLASGQRRSGARMDRFQRLAGQAAPGTEPLHRHRPPTRFGPGAPHLRADQNREAAQAQGARHIPRVELGQHGKLPVLHTR